MTDYATLLRDLLTLNVCCVDHRSSFPARLRSPVADGRLHLPFSPLATKFPYPFFRRFGKIRQQYLRANHRFAEEHTSPLKCEKGQDKEKIALPSLQSAAKKGQDRVILIGSAQEKAAIWKSWPRKGQQKKPRIPK